jgi:hypothetical protein
VEGDCPAHKILEEDMTLFLRSATIELEEVKVAAQEWKAIKKSPDELILWNVVEQYFECVSRVLQKRSVVRGGRRQEMRSFVLRTQ